MKKISEIMTIVLFVVCITSVLAVTHTSEKKIYSYYENRLYKSEPVATAEAVLDGSYFTEHEAFLCDHAAGRDQMLKLKTWMDVYVLGRPVVNDVVVTDQALLSLNPYEEVDREKIAEQAEKMAEQHSRLRDQVENYGGSYYYTAVPCQYVCYEDEYPSWLNSRAEFTEAEIASLTAAMEKYSVEMIDMRPVFEGLDAGQTDGSQESDSGSGTSGGSQSAVSGSGSSDGRKIYSSAVDNHYALEGAYLTYMKIIDRINNTSDHRLRYPTGDEITFTEIETPYLGSRQRKLMGVVSWDERLKVAEFAEDIPFARRDNGETVDAAVYSDAAFENGYVTYSLYMGGDIGETVLSTNRPELPSVLIYGDSFTNAVEVLAYYSFDEMRSIDMRYYSEMSVSEYIEKHRPDIVICIRDYESLLAADFNGDLFHVAGQQR